MPRPYKLAQDQLTHTRGHIDCPACDASRLRMINPSLLAGLNFVEAARTWFQSHTQKVGPGTVRHYTNAIARLTPFFGMLRLDQIHIGHFEQYQQQRSAGAGGLRPAGPSLINHELNTLSQILRRANLWPAIEPHYQPLKLPRPQVGVALSAEDEARLFRMAGSNPRWLVAYCCSLLTANTTAGPSEIRHLRMRDVDLDPPMIRITEGVKNDYRRRTVPLNEPAAWAIRQLYKRARSIGSTEPEHYLLPHRARNGGKGFDPRRPILHWRTAWNKLRTAAGMPNLRMYDLRHHAITRLLEDEEISERTVIELAGHVSRAMLERYSHIRLKAKLQAVQALARKGSSSERPAALKLVKS